MPVIAPLVLHTHHAVQTHATKRHACGLNFAYLCSGTVAGGLQADPNIPGQFYYVVGSSALAVFEASSPGMNTTLHLYA